MSGTDTGERSEKATDKHLNEARKKGRLSRSQDLTAWLGIGAAAIAMPAAIALGAGAGTEQLLTVTSLVFSPTPEAALGALSAASGSVLPTIAVMLAAVAIVHSDRRRGPGRRASETAHRALRAVQHRQRHPSRVRPAGTMGGAPRLC